MRFLTSGPCLETRFLVTRKTIHCNSPFLQCELERNIWILTFEPDVGIRDQILQIDWNSFVSSIGGSLGLFLGFSLLSSILSLHDLMLRIVSTWQHWRMTKKMAEVKMYPAESNED